MKLMKSSLGVMTIAVEPGDLTHAGAEQPVSLNQRVSPELFKLIEQNRWKPMESGAADAGDVPEQTRATE